MRVIGVLQQVVVIIDGSGGAESVEHMLTGGTGYDIYLNMCAIFPFQLYKLTRFLKIDLHSNYHSTRSLILIVILHLHLK